MILRGSVTVTEPLMISDPQATRLVRVEAFVASPEFAKAFADACGAPVPSVGQTAVGPQGVILWAEPKAWLVSGDAASLETALSPVAAVSDVSGAWRRIDVSGAGWRELLMVDGFFDAESPTFTQGCIAATVLHHAPVMLHVTGEQSVSVFVAPSFATDLFAAFKIAA